MEELESALAKALDTHGNLRAVCIHLELPYHTVYGWLQRGAVLADFGEVLRETGRLTVYQERTSAGESNASSKAG